MRIPRFKVYERSLSEWKEKAGALSCSGLARDKLKTGEIKFNNGEKEEVKIK